MIDKIIKAPIKFYAYLKKDFLLLVKRKKYLYLSIAIPLVVAVIFLFMLNPSKTGIRVEVCDYDNTEYTRQQISDLEGFDVRFLNLDNCREDVIAHIKSGKTALGLEIEKGFSEKINDAKPAGMIIYYDNTDIALSNLVSWKMDVSLNSYKRSIVDVFNQELKRKVSSLRSNVDIALELVSSSSALSKRIKLIDSDLKRIEEMPTDFLMNPIWTDQRAIYEEKLAKDSGIAFIFPIIAMFLVIMLAATSLIYDKNTNFLIRVKASTSPVLYILAKLVFFFAVTAAQFIIILLMFLIYGSTYSMSFLEVLHMLALVAFLNSLIGMVIGLISENEGIAILFSLMVSFPLMLLSGVFFPLQTMPGFLQYLAKIAPLYYQVSVVKSVMLFNQALSGNWIYAFIVLFLVVHYMIKRM
ncbi:ABC transporter permease [Candidatus Woesearchaeota archaeon]|nr:ABC transporter permease [Candidatus Woesearchaeota archaeon]